MLKDSDLMTFGEHQGQKIGDVPARYLCWLGDQTFTKTKYPALYQYIVKNRKSLEQEASEDKYNGRTKQKNYGRY